MIDQNVTDYYEDLRNRVAFHAGFESRFYREAFVGVTSAEIAESGQIDGLEPCHIKRQSMLADGYYFDDAHNRVDVYVADHQNRPTLETIKYPSIRSVFRKVRALVTAARTNGLYRRLEESTPEYDLVRGLADRKEDSKRVNFVLLTERYILPGSKRTLQPDTIDGIRYTYDAWDIGRLHRLADSAGQQEQLDVDLAKIFKKGIPCLQASLGQGALKSYLAAVPGYMLAGLYDRYQSRLLEQNVRVYLQARGKVNKGIFAHHSRRAESVLCLQ